jgi:hypothetical protein
MSGHKTRCTDLFCFFDGMASSLPSCARFLSGVVDMTSGEGQDGHVNTDKYSPPGLDVPKPAIHSSSSVDSSCASLCTTCQPTRAQKSGQHQATQRSHSDTHWWLNQGHHACFRRLGNQNQGKWCAIQCQAARSGGRGPQEKAQGDQGRQGVHESVSGHPSLHQGMRRILFYFTGDRLQLPRDPKLAWERAKAPLNSGRPGNPFAPPNPSLLTNQPMLCSGYPLDELYLRLGASLSERSWPVRVC